MSKKQNKKDVKARERNTEGVFDLICRATVYDNQGDDVLKVRWKAGKKKL